MGFCSLVFIKFFRPFRFLEVIFSESLNLPEEMDFESVRVFSFILFIFLCKLGEFHLSSFQNVALIDVVAKKDESLTGMKATRII